MILPYTKFCKNYVVDVNINIILFKIDNNYGKI